MILISYSTIFLLCGCSFLNMFRSFRFQSHIKLPTKPTQSGDMVSKKITLDTKSLTRLFSKLRASVNGKDDSIRSLDSEIKKIEDEIANLNKEIANVNKEIANLNKELSDTINEQERILIHQQIVENKKQLTAVRSSTGELIQTSQ